MEEFASGGKNFYNEKKKVTTEDLSTSLLGEQTFKETSDTEEQQQQSINRSDDFVGRSTPKDRSFEEGPDTFLDVSRVEMAEELQKQQNVRLERLWKHQSEQNRKIFEKLDESMTRQDRNASLREHHVRQLEDLRRYYEGEITALKKQLVDMKNVIFHQKEQEGSVKGEIQKEFENLTQMNLELSSKCDALESEIQLTQNQLKQTNLRKQELESQCQQLVAANQIIDVKCKELKRTKDEIQTKVTELNDQCDLVNNEKVILKRTKDDLERNYNHLQDEFQKVSDKSQKWKEESKIYRDRNKIQETLVEKTNKNVRELELVIRALKRELEDKNVKYEVDRSLFNATQQRVDRLVVQNRDKDLTIEDLEKKVKTLEQTIKDVSAGAAKAGLNEIRESIKKDKELLKRVLHEYDSLNERHEKTKGHVQHLEGKLAESQGEHQSLRKELSEANISRRNLENSLREVLGNSCRRIAERSTARRTWEQPASFNFTHGDALQDLQYNVDRLKYLEPKESTRRFSNLAEKDDVKHDKDRGENIKPLPSYRHYNNEDSLVCAYCNQLYKKGGNDANFEKSGLKTSLGLAHNHFKKYDFGRDKNEVKNGKWSKSKKNDRSKMEEEAVDRRAVLVSAEKRFLELSEQRRRLESALRKISASKMSRQDKEDKKFLESKLDEVLKELGNIRSQLRSIETD